MGATRWKRALAVGAIGIAAAGLAFGPVCRRAAQRAADRYGATLSVGAVRPTLHGVTLADVSVSVAELPGVGIHFAQVDASFGASGPHVVFHDGKVAAVGARGAVQAAVEAWRMRHLAGEGSSDGAGMRRSSGIEFGELELSWTNTAENPTEAFVASRVKLQRRGSVTHLSAEHATASFHGSSIVVVDAGVDIQHGDGTFRLAGLTASSVVADVILPVSPVTTLPAPPEAERETTIPAAAANVSAESKTVSRKERRGTHKDPKLPRPSEPADLPKAPPTSSRSAYRGAVIEVARLVDRTVAPGASIRVAGLRARVRRGDEALNLGPGTLSLDRQDGNLVVELSHGADARRSAEALGPGGPAGDEILTFRVAVPLGAEPREIAADVRGGPIWLSALGIHEGDFGLFDVARASLTTRSHLVLSGDGRTLTVDSETKVHALSIQSAALSDEGVGGLEVALQLRGSADLDGGRISVAQGELDLGAIRVLLRGDYERTAEGHRLRGAFDMPITACQAMLDSMPKGLVPKLQGMRLAGSFALRGHADLDTAHLDKSFGLDWEAANTCRVVEAPATIAVERFRAPFRRTAYDVEGRPVSLETGPGTADWVAGSAISKFMEAAVLTTEDSGFRRHHGFDHEAIRNSFRENIRRRRFVRGASTISMQLAKNLYLDRGKNLSRKLQEAVLTMYLEQELTKDQILELYLNVVEFGPMVYGIGPAARYYYNTDARSLSLGQALYISSIMPNPKVQHFGEGGAVTNSWMSYLRKLMKLARDRDLVTEEELDEGLRETVLRGSPTPLRSAKPISGADGEEPVDPLEDVQTF